MAEPAHPADADSGVTPQPPERDPGYDDALGELPPNVPPGMLGERGMDLYKQDDDGPHGLNAGLLQETSIEVVALATILAYVLFFPLAYVIVWRAKSLSLGRKWLITALMTAGVITVVTLFATGVIYFA